MKIPRRITYSWLSARKACIEQRRVFRAEWPDGADLTEANLLRAAELGLGLDWLANQLLTAQLLAEYDWQRAPLCDEYERQTATLWDEYERQRAPFLAEYRRQTAPLLGRLLAAEEGK